MEKGSLKFDQDQKNYDSLLSIKELFLSII